MQLIQVGLEDLLGPFIRTVDDGPDFLIDIMRGLIRDMLVLGYRMSQKDLFLLVTVGERAELL